MCTSTLARTIWPRYSRRHVLADGGKQWLIDESQQPAGPIRFANLYRNTVWPPLRTPDKPLLSVTFNCRIKRRRLLATRPPPPAPKFIASEKRETWNVKRALCETRDDDVFARIFNRVSFSFEYQFALHRVWVRGGFGVGEVLTFWRLRQFVLLVFYDSDFGFWVY